MSKIEVITSLNNPKIKQVVKLRQRKERDSQKLFIIEGYRELSLALHSSFAIKEFFYCEELLNGKHALLFDESSKRGAQIFKVSKKVFLKIAFGERQEGVLALAKERHFKLNDISLSKNPLVVVVESLEKPGNLGAILRTCDAAGVDAVIVCDGKTDIYNPNCIRASLGAFFSVPVLEETSQNVIDWLKKNKFEIFLALTNADTLYSKVSFLAPTALVLGSENKGLSLIWQNASDLKIKIPMNGKVDSLNVAMAASILIFEALRQRETI
ncbi:MAG: RNA methyltransferase [Candidatus Omnitrophota bacterium]|nr:RNA methyltransferase [Candidatus Omnitrophota bacterium]